MGKKVESYLSDDGKLFTSERDMVLHEIEIALGEDFPELRVQMPLIMKSIDRITAIVQPLHILHMKNHPEPAPETTLRPEPPCFARQSADRMTCRRCNLVWDTNDPAPPACKPIAAPVARRIRAIEDGMATMVSNG